MKLILPATTANLGSGYDTLGLAMTLYNTFEFWESEEDIVMNWDEDPSEHLVIQAMREAQYVMSFPKKKVMLSMQADIPVKRGLGSSAVCIVAGVMIAFLLDGRPVDPKRVLEISNQLEGHPDNIAPVIYGGFTAAMQTETDVYVQELEIHESIEPIVVIPPFPFATKAAREAIPEMIPHSDAVFNVSRIGLLVGALAKGELEHLGVFTDDRLHEIYRFPMIEACDVHYASVTKKLESLCESVTLSGAGPTLLGLTNDKTAKSRMIAWIKEEGLDYEVLDLRIDRTGYRIEGDLQSKY